MEDGFNVAAILFIVILLYGVSRKYRQLDIERGVQYRNLAFNPHYYVTSFGFQAPWHPWQLSIFFFFVVENGLFYGIVMQRLWGVMWDAIPVLVVAHFIVLALCVALFVWLELHDPGAKPEERSLPAPFHCQHCDTAYAGRHRKHCWSCNKCVTDFDHHCKYLNTCIGGSNYRPWVLFIVTLVLTLGTQLTACIYGLGSDWDPGVFRFGANVSYDGWWAGFTVLAALLQGLGFFTMTNLLRCVCVCVCVLCVCVCAILLTVT